MDKTTNRVTSKSIRRIILEQSKRANVGHIGCCLSVADIVAMLYDGVLHVSRPEDSDRDRFVLSKGHAGLALHAALHLRGWISAEELNTFCTDGGMVATHPEHLLKGVDFSTGSLGQGLSMAAGSALAATLQKSKRRVFALMSDAECNEGSIWEAAMFSAHHRLSNLIAIVDLNGQQAFGYTRDVMDLNPMAKRWSTFGWDVHEVDGHDVQAMARTIEDLKGTQPHMLIARTTFGKGVSFMESQIKWHYWPMSDEDYRKALEEVEKGR